MASRPLGEDTYPDPLIAAGRGSAGLWRVLLLGLVLVAAAVVFSLFGEQIPADMVLTFVGILAVAGVFCLFGLAAGLFRFANGEERRTISNAVVDSLPFGAVVADRDGKIAYVNAHYGNFAGAMTNGVPVGVPRLFAGQSDASEAIYRLSRAGKDGRSAMEDIRLVGGLGGSISDSARAFWYRVSVRPLPESDETSKPLVIWSVEDITRDKDSNESAFRDLQRAIDYLDHSPAGFFSADAHGAIQYLNSTLTDWLGYDLAEFNAGHLRLSDLVRGDGATLLMRGRGDGEIRTEIIDIDLVRRNGTSFPVRLLHRAARLADGELGETRTLVLDKSNAPDTEEELRAAEVRFSRFFNDTPFAIATLDREGRIIRTNAPFGRIFKWSGEEKSLEMQPLSELIGEQSRDKFARAIADAAALRSEVEPVDALLSAEGDHAVRLYLSSSEMSAGSGDEQVNVYALDMTDQRKLEAQFAQSQKMQAVGQLAGGVAHDFNNLLTAIIGFSDLLLLKHKPGDPSFSELMQIKQNANRAAGLTRQLLAFSRRQTLRPQVLELPLIVDDLTVLLKRMIGEKNTLGVEHGRNIWPVRADVVQLEQVIINLVVNARDAMPNGGSITIRTSNVERSEAERMTFEGMVPADYVLIDVQDTGTGMSQEVIEKIFEPFFTTKELGKGTGLGLSTVYGIVKQTEGYIYPVSVVGVGTTFKIFLPRHVQAANEVGAKAAAAAPVRDLTGHERILLVDDEESVRAFSAQALRATGYEVFEADGGEEALEILEDEDFKIDLMISDVAMPEMDGPTLLKHVRETMPNLKVIFVSGYAEESVRRDIEDDQSVEFLPKPYSLDQINSKVKEVLQMIGKSDLN